MAASTSKKEAPAPDAQLAFGWLLPWSDRKQNLTTQEVASVMSMSQDGVRELVESGVLEAHRFTVFGGAEARLTNRITRRSVVLWFARTAKYAPEGIVDAMVEVARTLTPELLAGLITRLQQLQKGKQ